MIRSTHQFDRELSLYLMFSAHHNGPMSTAIHSLIALGYDLDAHGFAGREAAVRQLVRTARASGFDGPAVAVLADAAAPDVARMRAFAAVSAALASATDPHRGDREFVAA
jgi:hypothetical protein